MLNLCIFVIYKNMIMKKEEKIENVINIICEYYNITRDQFKSKSRKFEIVQVRHLVVYMIRYEMGLTFREIGEILNKEVSTIIRNFQSISDIIRHDVILQKDIKEIKEKIQNKK